jgi:hypothetical protein
VRADEPGATRHQQLHRSWLLVVPAACVVPG